MTDLKTIREFCKRVVQEFRPQKVILFGSYAYGRPTADSDVDLLVVMRFRGRGVRKAIEIESRLPPPFPLDLLVRTPAQLRRRLAINDFFLREVVEKGRILYEASDS